MRSTSFSQFGLPDWLQSKNLRLLVTSRMTMSAARSLTGVIVPIYLARLGFSALDIGLLFIVTAVSSGVLTAAVGLLADRFGRKPFLIVFPLLTALAGTVYLLTRDFGLILLFAAVGSLGRGTGAGGGGIGPYVPAESALIAGSVQPHRRSVAFGVAAFCAALGALFGGLLAGIPDLAARAGARGVAAYQPAFLVLVVLSLVTSSLALPLKEEAPSVRRSRRVLSLPKQSMPILLRLVATNSLNGLAMGAIGPFITYWFYIRYHAGPGEVGLLYAVINLASIAPNLATGAIASRLGLVRAVVFVRATGAALLVAMAFMPTFLLAGAVYLVRMVVQRVGMPLRQSYVMGVVPDSERSSVAGLSNMPAQLSSALTPAISGDLMEHVSLALPFVLAAALQLVNAVIYYGFFHAIAPPEEDGRYAQAAPPPVSQTSGAEHV
jgi:MFS family permease